MNLWEYNNEKSGYIIFGFLHDAITGGCKNKR